MRSIRKRVKSGEGAQSGRRYIYARQLSFLLKQGHLPNTQTSIAEGDCEDDATVVSEKTRVETEPRPSSSFPRSNPTKRRRDLEDSLISFMNTPVPHNTPAPEANDDRSFFESLIPMVSSFSIEQKLDFRSGVLNLVKKIRSVSHSQGFSTYTHCAPDTSPQQQQQFTNQPGVSSQYYPPPPSPMSNISASTVHSFEEVSDSMDLFQFP